MIFNFNVFSMIRKFSIYQLDGSEGGASSEGGSAPEATPAAPVETGAPSSAPSSSSPSSAPASADKMAPMSPSPDDFSVERFANSMVKVKVNGQEKEIPLSRVIQDYQRDQASQERFAKASEIQKQNDAMIAAFKKSPAEALKAFGIDPVEFSQKQLEDFIRSKEETPEARELRELRAFREASEAEKKILVEQQEQQQRTAAVNAAAAEIETKIIDSMTKHNLPRDPSVVGMIADYMARGHDEGYTVTAEMAASLVKEDLQNNYKHLIGQFSPEQLYGFLGDDTVKKMRDYELAKLKSPTPPPVPAAAPEAANTPKQRAGESLSQFNRRIRNELMNS